ncbi:testis-expressed sequence 36 protein-like [Plakobranchus ocellatus]|uniref:Testis-expressed sequence 36 protein-like n=1 Tax=Plakobranchus ocellatus TaxID=259542 RepID=A0AAV3YIR9_9GAST|nr:testis-expressed sequence 36 protein-like [Plakobranchus ocellatus]
MTKGRKFAPSSANEGVWFRHKGEPGDVEGRLRDVTSTRQMLEAPFSAPCGPRSPPLLYAKKEEPMYNQSNPFTQHDNRHYFQDKGEYFGNGRDTRYLGRRLHSMEGRLHHTGVDYLHHHSRAPTLRDYNPITATSYSTPGPVEPITRRRFPRTYKPSEMNKEDNLKLTSWATSPYRTSMHVLAVSQEPYLNHNSWKYSFHGHNKVYPPYDRKKLPHVPNVLNRYGPDFATVPKAAPAQE